MIGDEVLAKYDGITSMTWMFWASKLQGMHACPKYEPDLLCPKSMPQLINQLSAIQLNTPFWGSYCRTKLLKFCVFGVGGKFWVIKTFYECASISYVQEDQPQWGSLVKFDLLILPNEKG